MKGSLLLTLLAAATVAACQTPTAPDSPPPADALYPDVVAMRGVVGTMPTPDAKRGFVLRATDGRVVELDGLDEATAEALIGEQVEAEGWFETPTRLLVTRIVVLAGTKIWETPGTRR